MNESIFVPNSLMKKNTVNLNILKNRVTNEQSLKPIKLCYLSDQLYSVGSTKIQSFTLKQLKELLETGTWEQRVNFIDSWMDYKEITPDFEQVLQELVQDSQYRLRLLLNKTSH